jgi:uncharacterized protein YutE (UPF0331/DUF86 family)
MPGPHDDVGFNKAAIIARCITRIHQEYEADPDLQDITHVDALTLNIERACQAAIDLAFHIVSSGKLGLPQTSGDAFLLLARTKLIKESTARSMVAMTGFRNIAIHEYQAMDMSILKAVARTHWVSLVTFCEELGFSIGKEPRI